MKHSPDNEQIGNFHFMKSQAVGTRAKESGLTRELV